MSTDKKSSKHKTCCFCELSQDNELELGKFYECEDICTHYYCLLLSSNMQQRGKDNQGILGFLLKDIKKEVRRGKKLICVYCKKTGATLGCCNIKCKRIFHYPCGMRAGTLNQFFHEFRSYCRNHRPKQKIDAQVKKELARSSETMCYICYEKVDPYDAVSTIWAPCCKKNAWFHRLCVQQLALSAGYFFKCPLCNDKKIFQRAMLEFGIFIPRQDASWELVPNAFQELLYRHDQCDAPICLCPKGRKHTSLNAKWELALCRTCGSQGIHMACGQLKWTNPLWECTECISIIGKSTEIPSSSQAENVHLIRNNADCDDSDSDISVGKNSPIPFMSPLPIISPEPQKSTIKLRPGPRTFKLKQIRACEEMQRRNKEQAIENTNGLHSTVVDHDLESTSNGSISTNINSFDSISDTLIAAENTEDNFENNLHRLQNNADDIQIEKSLYNNNLKPIDANKSLVHIHSEIECDSLDHENMYTCNNSTSNIQISNVISLSSQILHGTLSTASKENISDDELPNDMKELTSKRKIEENSSYPIVSSIDISKRLRKGNKELDEISGSCNTLVDNYTCLIFDNDNAKSIDNNERTPNQELLIQIKENDSIGVPDTSRPKNILETSESFEVVNDMENCGGDAGTSPAIESRNENITSDAKRVKSNNLKTEKAQLSVDDTDTATAISRASTTKSHNGSYQGRTRNTQCNYHRLIPEYIHLRDLKFRVHNLNNLQMILYDKLSVNINLESANTMIQNSTVNTSGKKIVPQNSLKDQIETPENILQSISSTCHKDKFKYTYLNEQLENFEHMKENLDPVATISARNTTENLVTDTLLVLNDTSVSTNENPIETKNMMQSASNVMQDNEGRSQNNISLDNANDRNFEVSTSCKNECIKNNGTRSVLETHRSKNSLENESQNSTKLLRRALFSENCANSDSESDLDTANKADLKVSIDLKKIQTFIGKNPNLFS